MTRICLAGFFSYSVLSNLLESLHGIASTTASSKSAVDKSLWRESKGQAFSASSDHNSISKDRGDRFCPAGATIFGNVLIFGPSDVVDTIDVSPVPGVGEGLFGDVGERSRLRVVGSVDTGVRDVVVFELHGFLFEVVWEEFAGFLDECFDVFTVFHVIFAVVLEAFGPSVVGDGPGAGRLDTESVVASADVEESFLAPEISPGVSGGPEGLIILNSPTNDFDGMVDVGGVRTIEDASFVVH